MKLSLPKLNLQLFGDSDVLEGVDTSIANPLLADEVSTPDVVDVPTDNEPVDSGGVDHTEPTQTSTSDYSDISSKIDSILQRMNQQPATEEPVVEEPPQATEEELEQLNNDFYNKFTERPLDALQELIEERANAKIAPIQQYFDNMQKMNYWNEQIDNFEKQNPDFKDYAGEISQLIQSDESIRNSKNPLELAYKVVRSDKLESQLKEISKPLDEQLKDESVLKELLNNPEIKNLIFQQLKTNKDSIPKVIGTDGNTVVNVEDKPRSVEDATKAWLNS